MLEATITPREELFKPAEVMAVKISPQGNRFCEVRADAKGTMNLYLDQGEQLTFFTEPEIKRFYWSSDGKKILFLKDEDGTRNFHIWSVDTQTKELKNYTADRELVLGTIYGVSTSSNCAAIGVAGKNPLYHDVYHLDLESGELTLQIVNDRYGRFWFDENLEVAFKAAIQRDGAMTVFDARDEVFLELSPEDAFHTAPIFTHGKTCYLVDSRTSDTTTLKKVNLETGEETPLAHDPKSDIGEVIFEGDHPIAYSTCYTRTEWHPLEEQTGQDLAFLTNQIGTEFELLSQSKDGNHWILRSSQPLRGVELYHFHRKQRKLERLFQTPQLKEFSDMHSLVIRSRDGLDLVCYLTLPKAFDQGGKPSKPLPLVLIPHGGPFQVRDTLCFNPYHQWLASRGYGVLSVNFRLSSGFGKAFVNAGNGEWGGKAQEDLIDAANWCIANNIAVKDKIAIFGGSYGGYAALAGLTFYPDYFACSVAVCAPSNLKTVMQKVPLYWESSASALSDKGVFFTKGAFVTSMGGDPDSEEESKHLEARSPLNYIDAIQKPFLLIHGDNDPIVAKSESDQIFEAMKKKSKPLTYLAFPDEGHGMRKFHNIMMELAYSEKFLSDILGGDYQPLSPIDEENSQVRINQSISTN